MKFKCGSCGALNEVETQQKRAAEARWRNHRKKPQSIRPRGRPRKERKSAKEPETGIYICGVCNTAHKSLSAMKACMKGHSK